MRVAIISCASMGAAVADARESVCFDVRKHWCSGCGCVSLFLLICARIGEAVGVRVSVILIVDASEDAAALYARESVYPHCLCRCSGGGYGYA